MENFLPLPCQKKDDMKTQLKELATNKILETMFPNLNRLAKICLFIPVGTASVETSFFPDDDLNTIEKSHWRKYPFLLMKIAIESPEKLR